MHRVDGNLGTKKNFQWQVKRGMGNDKNTINEKPSWEKDLRENGSYSSNYNNLDPQHYHNSSPNSQNSDVEQETSRLQGNLELEGDDLLGDEQLGFGGDATDRYYPGDQKITSISLQSRSFHIPFEW